MTCSDGGLSGLQSLPEVIPALWSVVLHPDPPWRAEVGDQWSQPVLATDWPGKIPPIDLQTAIKAQLQEEGVLSPHKGHTSSTQLGG